MDEGVFFLFLIFLSSRKNNLRVRVSEVAYRVQRRNAAVHSNFNCWNPTRFFRRWYKEYESHTSSRYRLRTRVKRNREVSTRVSRRRDDGRYSSGVELSGRVESRRYYGKKSGKNNTINCRCAEISFGRLRQTIRLCSSRRAMHTILYGRETFTRRQTNKATILTTSACLKANFNSDANEIEKILNLKLNISCKPNPKLVVRVCLYHFFPTQTHVLY